MSNKLISQQATCTIAFAGAQDGVPSSWGTAVNLQCLAKSWTMTRNYTTTNLAAICDTEEQMQIIRAGGQVTLELFVDYTSEYQFYASVGYYAKVILTPKSGGTALTFQGVLTGWEAGSQEGGAQTEKLTITVGTNGI